MHKIFIQPAPDRIVRDPVTMTPLKAEGEEKPRSVFWVRRLKAGDVVGGKRLAQPKKPQAAKTETKED